MLCQVARVGLPAKNHPKQRHSDGADPAELTEDSFRWDSRLSWIAAMVFYPHLQSHAHRVMDEATSPCESPL